MISQTQKDIINDEVESVYNKLKTNPNMTVTVKTVNHFSVTESDREKHNLMPHVCEVLRSKGIVSESINGQFSITSWEFSLLPSIIL